MPEIPPSPPRSSNQEVLISACSDNNHYWRDLRHYKELFLFLAWRDIRVRYKQTSLGIAWALIRPLLTMLAFTLVFGRLAGMPDNGRPYPLLVLAGLLPWQFFASNAQNTANCLLANAGMITKVYFPRIILPASTVMVNVVDFAVAMPLLLLLMLSYGLLPGVQVVALPFFLIQLFCLAFGCGIWMAALTARYRDLTHAVPFLILVGLYISPVGFSSSAVPENWHTVFAMNPMATIIDGFRWSILNTPAPSVTNIALSWLITLLLGISGWSYFRSIEPDLAEIL
jgi:lipopolysaccharide transport system permease protein